MPPLSIKKTALVINVAGKFVVANKRAPIAKNASAIHEEDAAYMNGDRIATTYRAKLGNPAVKNRMPANVSTLADKVLFIKLEQSRPNNAYVIAATIINSCEMNNSTQDTPPSIKAMLCSGNEAKTSRKT